jgi:hypothetical protein
MPGNRSVPVVERQPIDDGDEEPQDMMVADRGGRRGRCGIKDRPLHGSFSKGEEGGRSQVGVVLLLLPFPLPFTSGATARLHSLLFASCGLASRAWAWCGVV